VCNARLQRPGCRWKMMDTDDLGVPCASNQENAWQRSLRAEFRAPPRVGLNRTAFNRMFAQLQRPGGHRLLPGAPQRLYHPVKGQLTSIPNGARSPPRSTVRKGMNRTRISVGSRTRVHAKRVASKQKMEILTSEGPERSTPEDLWARPELCARLAAEAAGQQTS